MSAPLPTLVMDGFTAYIDWIAYEESSWLALLHACSLFGQKTAVEAIRARLRMGEIATLHLSKERSARLVDPDCFVTRTRRVGAVTHVTLFREPQSLTAQQSLLIVREGEDPAPRFYRLCDALVTTPLHPSWAAWLWQWATETDVVHALRTISCQAWTVSIDELRLEQALANALHKSALILPNAAS